MAKKRLTDFVVVAPEFTSIHLIDLVLKPFGLPLLHPKHADQHILVGYLEEMDHHFGPTMLIETRSEVGIRLRIPWGYVLGVVTAAANPKDLGFVTASRARQRSANGPSLRA